MSKILPRYAEYDGFRLAEPYLLEGFRSATNFKPGPEDVIVATFPKCGTTWMCQIVRLVLSKGKHAELTPEEYYKCFPFFELHGAEGVLNMSKPGCIKTHLPFDRLNFSEEAKYIYVARHPRDCVVSFYHHTRFFPVYRFTDGKFEDFFDLFINGMTDYNDYFDHLLSWYKQRHRPNILFLTYEYMKKNHRDTILKVADFLGCVLTESEIDNIIKYSSFEHMKKETNEIFNNFSNACISDEIGKNLNQLANKAIEDGYKPVGNFIRKGIVGEGKTVLSEEQEERLKARILEKTEGIDVMSLWEET